MKNLERLKDNNIYFITSRSFITRLFTKGYNFKCIEPTRLSIAKKKVQIIYNFIIAPQFSFDFHLIDTLTRLTWACLQRLEMRNEKSMTHLRVADPITMHGGNEFIFANIFQLIGACCCALLLRDVRQFFLAMQIQSGFCGFICKKCHIMGFLNKTTFCGVARGSFILSPMYTLVCVQPGRS